MYIANCTIFFTANSTRHIIASSLVEDLLSTAEDRWTLGPVQAYVSFSGQVESQSFPRSSLLLAHVGIANCILQRNSRGQLKVAGLSVIRHVLAQQIFPLITILPQATSCVYKPPPSRGKNPKKPGLRSLPWPECREYRYMEPLLASASAISNDDQSSRYLSP